jgi:Fe-S-cluster-containing dehydrogenase component
MQFEERTIKVIIDEEKCHGCKTHVCVDACKKYSRGILVIKDGKPALGGDAEYAKRRHRVSSLRIRVLVQRQQRHHDRGPFS